jgi:aromatic-amino-acid transaminase
VFELLNAQPPDSLLGLIKAFNSDARSQKIDLGVGVYRDGRGRTPVLKAVKEAERILHETQDSKGYLGPEGDVGFSALLRPIVFGSDNRLAGRIAALQTPGGTGALRLGAELVRAATPNAVVRLGTPTWPNHAPIFTAAGLGIEARRFADLEAQTIDFESVRRGLAAAQPGDVVLLHGCCHNPTGMDFSRKQWKEIAETLKARKLVPFVDLAYQGLGDGLDEDASATRLVLETVDEALLAYSCDKNFGLYRDRVGALFVLARDEGAAATVMGNLASLARVAWSMPPDHGAAVVRIILEHPELVAMWREELDGMRARINGNRAALAAADPELAFVRNQRGLFSNLAMTKPQAQALRARHAIYCADSGRINLAGMQPEDAAAIVAALRAEDVSGKKRPPVGDGRPAGAPARVAGGAGRRERRGVSSPPVRAP